MITKAQEEGCHYKYSRLSDNRVELTTSTVKTNPIYDGLLRHQNFADILSSDVDPGRRSKLNQFCFFDRF